MYLVQYNGGEYTDDKYTANLFATANKKVAEKYVLKFNTLLNKMKKHYDEMYYYKSMLCSDEKHDKWSVLTEIGKCFYTEIKLR